MRRVVDVFPVLFLPWTWSFSSISCSVKPSFGPMDLFDLKKKAYFCSEKNCLNLQIFDVIVFHFGLYVFVLVLKNAKLYYNSNLNFSKISKFQKKEKEDRAFL